MFPLLAPFLGPLLSLLFLLTIGPCVINRILRFVRERFDTIQLMVLRAQYQPVSAETESDLQDPRLAPDVPEKGGNERDQMKKTKRQK